MENKKISLLGSTGSIGTQTLDVVSTHPEELQVTALAAGKRNLELLAGQVQKFEPELVAVPTEEERAKLKELIPKYKGRIEIGKDGLLAAASHSSANTVVGAMVGFAGLVPVMAAIKAGKRICLANKETLVAAGEVVTKLAKEHNVHVLPIDSEHSAVLQSLAGGNESVEKIILTASGGPFREFTLEQMAKVTPSMALKHPNWSMGAKITVDSATMMNKGLEVIEAHWLFDVVYDKIDVVVHPQSIVHSMVEFHDGSIIGQMGLPDMRLPILYALTYPRRLPTEWPRLNLVEIGELTFFKPDLNKFTLLHLAREAGFKGGTFPTVLNAANEVAVELFLSETIGFLDISALVESVLTVHDSKSLSLETIIEADSWARHKAKEIASKQKFLFSIST